MDLLSIPTGFTNVNYYFVRFATRGGLVSSLASLRTWYDLILVLVSSRARRPTTLSPAANFEWPSRSCPER